MPFCLGAESGKSSRFLVVRAVGLFKSMMGEFP